LTAAMVTVVGSAWRAITPKMSEQRNVVRGDFIASIRLSLVTIFCLY
jgi:hypothetical protein